MIDFLQALIKHSTNSHTKESKRRAEICNSCPEKKKAVYADFVNSQIVEINGYICGLCDCPLATKIFAKKKCYKWK